MERTFGDILGTGVGVDFVVVSVVVVFFVYLSAVAAFLPDYWGHYQLEFKHAEITSARLVSRGTNTRKRGKS